MEDSQKERRVMLVDKNYGLTIHALIESKGEYEPLCFLESEIPFPAIQAGDIINPRMWQGESGKKYQKFFKNRELLKVSEVHHHITINPDDSHRIYIVVIYAKAIKN